ncbi:MAG: DUF3365 domain-containing protein [Xanthomonadales bacterium]|nr:DUF3365 domain-containing protein [Xanthomonadales bacterium]
MKQILLGLCLVMLAMNGSSDQQSESIQAETDKAKAAIRELAVALKTELKGAMQAGGPVAAIGVCNTQAMPITQKVANEQGLLLSRVSLKNRNPANLPNEWQIAVLEDFEQQKAAGKDVSSLAWSETVEVDGKQEFRFMKAIPTDPVCLNCHGTDLSPDVSRILADLYPIDRATGYREGDIRGAFVATSEP